MDFKIGDRVTYHGSMNQYHDREYTLTWFVEHELDEERGWELSADEANWDDKGSHLWNVHTRSLRKVE